MDKPTIQKISDLENVKVRFYPFQSRKRAFWILQDKRKGYTFSKSDVQILSQTIGDSPDILRLEAFLRKHCSVATEPEFRGLAWPKIIADLELHLVEQGTNGVISGASGRPMKTDGPPPEVRAIAALAENPNTTMTTIAKKAGVHRTRLYDTPRFMAAWNLHRAGKAESSHDAKPRGEIGPESDRIEMHKQ